jgi:hypothetical protein
MKHQENMERKFGTVGFILAKGAESSGCCATAITTGGVRAGVRAEAGAGGVHL